jgi:hypothetical protein
MKGDAGSLDGLKIFGVAGREWQAKPDGNGGNQAIREFNNRALLAGRGLDGGGLEIIGGGWRNFFVLVQPEQSFLQLCRGFFEFKPKNNFMHSHTGESEYAVLTGVVGDAANKVPVMPLEIFGEDVGIEEGFGPSLQRGRRTGRAASFLVSNMDNFINQRRIVRAAE